MTQRRILDYVVVESTEKTFCEFRLPVTYRASPRVTSDINGDICLVVCISDGDLSLGHIQSSFFGSFYG